MSLLRTSWVINQWILVPLPFSGPWALKVYQSLSFCKIYYSHFILEVMTFLRKILNFSQECPFLLCPFFIILSWFYPDNILIKWSFEKINWVEILGFRIDETLFSGLEINPCFQILNFCLQINRGIMNSVVHICSRYSICFA